MQTFSRDDLGSIKIHKKVLAQIITDTVGSMEGVRLAEHDFAGTLMHWVGLKLAPGISVQTAKDGRVRIEVRIHVQDKLNIPDIARRTQDAVRSAIERTVDIDLQDVNINILGIERGERMKFINRLGVAWYMVSMLFLGVIAGLFALHLIDPYRTMTFCYFLFADTHGRIGTCVFAGVVLLLNFIFWKALTASEVREQNIAFDNPAGRVSVSLPAMEDLIRRVIAQQPEVKDVKTSLKAVKKGLMVNARLALNADVNIPEMTSSLQDLVRRKVQDTIGIEEPVMVRIDVSKIAPGAISKKPRKAPDAEPKKEEPNIPFEGYRA